MRLAGQQQQGRLSNRAAIRTPLVGRSALGGNERVDVYTTMLRDGNLFYVLTVVPEREEGNYSADVQPRRAVGSSQRSLMRQEQRVADILRNGEPARVVADESRRVPGVRRHVHHITFARDERLLPFERVADLS